jgi:fructokinase
MEYMSFKVLGIGEVLWDLLPSGPQLGGAPGNFACHARSLGAQASVVARVGNDSLGRLILERFEHLNIADGTMQVDDEAPTGTVTVSLSGKGIPHFTIHEQVAWDRLVITQKGLDAVRQADAVCFGTLAQRGEPSRNSIQRLVSAASADALRVLDINLRQNYYSREVIEISLCLANVLKLNDSELPVLAGLFNLSGPTRRQIEQLAQNSVCIWSP